MSPLLFALVPLVLLPVVGLLAFAGCTGSDPEPVDPAPVVIVSPNPNPNPNPNPDPRPDPDPDPVPVRPSYAETIQGTTGIVSHWPLSDPTGSVRATSLGPVELHGTYTPEDLVAGAPGGALTPRQVDTCARLGGTSGRVTIPFSPQINPAGMLQFSVEVWCRPRSIPDRPKEDEFLASSVHFGAGTNPTTGWQLFARFEAGGALSFVGRVFAGAAATAFTAVEVPVPSAGPGEAWHHVVLTFDGGSGTLGLVVHVVGDPAEHSQTKAGATLVANPDAPLLFGAGQGLGLYNFFTGDLDEAAFYNRVLRSDEIAAHRDAATADV